MSVFKQLVTFLFLLSISLGFAQEEKNDTSKKEIPASIYTATQISTNLNSALNINERLNLRSYKFLVLDEQNIERGYFTTPLFNKKLTTSNYIYDTYNKIHQKSVLEAAFFKISDLYQSRTKNAL